MATRLALQAPVHLGGLCGCACRQLAEAHAADVTQEPLSHDGGCASLPQHQLAQSNGALCHCVTAKPGSVGNAPRQVCLSSLHSWQPGGRRLEIKHTRISQGQARGF